MRVVYLPREPQQLQAVPGIEHGVFATPSIEADTLIKRMLAIHSGESVVGTCLVGFDIKLASLK